MNRRRLAIIIACAAIGAAAACADIVGIVDVPDGATDLDAATCAQDAGNACLGDVPSGWTRVGALVNPTSTCPADAGFVQDDFITNARFAAGACACGSCTASGSWSCGEGTLGMNTSCANPQWGLVNSTYCYKSPTYFTLDGGTYILVAPPALTFTSDSGAQCHVSTVGSNQVTTDPVRLCAPTSCNADLCGLQAQGFSACIMHSGELACPSPYVPLKNTPSGHVAPKGGENGTCNACSCTVDDAGSSSVVFTLYNTTDCSSGAITTISGCQYIDAAVASQVQAYKYDPTCTPSSKVSCTTKNNDPGGDASLVNVSTVCCTSN